MNWREHPYLFANGKFELMFGGKHRQPFQAFHLSQVVNIHVNFPNAYKLIARKIEDMTDEEIETLYEEAHFGTISGEPPTYDEIKEYSSDVRDGFLYLLSIGVYPFEWDETVIDIKTLEQ